MEPLLRQTDGVAQCVGLITGTAELRCVQSVEVMMLLLGMAPCVSEVQRTNEGWESTHLLGLEYGSLVVQLSPVEELVKQCIQVQLSFQMEGNR